MSQEKQIKALPAGKLLRDETREQLVEDMAFKYEEARVKAFLAGVQLPEVHRLAMSAALEVAEARLIGSSPFRHDAYASHNTEGERNRPPSGVGIESHQADFRGHDVASNPDGPGQKAVSKDP